MAKKSKIEVFDLDKHAPILQRAVMEQLLSDKAKSRKFTVVKPNEIGGPFIVLKPFILQWALGCVGLKKQTMTEIIGQEHVGKTTFILDLLSQFIANNSLALYEETENKLMLEDRIKRCLSRDRAMADKLFSMMSITSSFTIHEAYGKIDGWHREIRGQHHAAEVGASVPPGVHLVAAIDTFSKLMSPAEAEGVYAYGADTVESPAKEMGAASNMGHSKFAHVISRFSPGEFSQRNASLIICSHQNQKVNMTSFPGAKFIPADMAAAKNKTKIGGNAFNQSAAVQLMLTNIGTLKNTDGQEIGHKVKLSVLKNSFGPKGRMIEFDLNQESDGDTETSYAPVISFADFTARFFADRGLLGTRVTNKRYTCEALDVSGATGEEFTAALESNEKVRSYVGAKLAIYGYKKPDDLDLPKSCLEDAPPKDEAPDET